MSTENANPAVAEALAAARECSNLMEYIDSQITNLGKSMQQDTLAHRNNMYNRKSFTIGALVAFDPEVRRVASRAGVDLRVLDDNIAIASQAVMNEMTKNNPIGQKLIKVIRDAYVSGNYR